jgi:lipopolysaccharide transport protein LptA
VFASSTELLKKFDTLDIEADNIDTLREKEVVVFTGNVIAKQKNNDLNFFSDKISLEYKIDENNKISAKEMHASGNVIIKRGSITITGKRGFYDIKKNLVTMQDNVALYDETGKVYGDKVVYDIAGDDAQVFGKTNQEKQEQVVIILDDVEKTKEIYGKQK